MSRAPRLSVVIVAFEMARELPRVVHSLSPACQRGIDAADYELVVVDNGSQVPPDAEAIATLAPNTRLIKLDASTPSPARALNVGVAAARGDFLGIMIDGAHIVTPRALGLGLRAVSAVDHGVAHVPPFSLGWDASQLMALESGYSIAREDELLASVDWADNAYTLFDVAAPVRVAPRAWLRSFAEANLFFVSRSGWAAIGGADERFSDPGGGFLNLDLIKRALELPGAQCISLLGEATFHQLHGNLAERGSRTKLQRVVEQRQQYEALRSRRWVWNEPESRIWFGTLPPEARPHLLRGPAIPYDRAVHSVPAPDEDERVAPLVALAQAERNAARFEAAAAICRTARSHLGDVPAIMSILAVTSPLARLDEMPDSVKAEAHAGTAQALMILGQRDQAAVEFEAALALDPTLVAAQFGAAAARLPGDDYITHLTRLHAQLRPRVYVEIGVATGRTFALAQPPTIAIGVDPTPSIDPKLRAESHIYPQRSDDFFAGPATTVLATRELDLSFIDGLHVFEQALRDFANVEHFGHPRTVVVLHDTIPLSEATQAREQGTAYWTGDVWKLIVLLAERRPALTMFTIPTYPSGLTVITNLDPTRQLDDWADARTVDEYAAIDFATVGDRLERALQRIPNSWEAVAQWLLRPSQPAAVVS